jgi:hypothetical protein
MDCSTVAIGEFEVKDGRSVGGEGEGLGEIGEAVFAEGDGGEGEFAGGAGDGGESEGGFDGPEGDAGVGDGVVLCVMDDAVDGGENGGAGGKRGYDEKWYDEEGRESHAEDLFLNACEGANRQRRMNPTALRRAVGTF